MPGNLHFFNFAIAFSTSNGLSPGAYGSAACISIYLTSLTLYALNSFTYSKCCGNLQEDKKIEIC
jgi:hypothetical protein